MDTTLLLALGTQQPHQTLLFMLFMSLAQTFLYTEQLIFTVHA